MTISTPEPTSIPTRNVVAALLVSGTAGFLVGCFLEPTWSQVVESAQALAGLVESPWPTPFYVFNAKLWSLLNQVGALILRAGVSERMLCIFLSGFLGLLSFQAFALIALALSREWVWAAAVPVAIYAIGGPVGITIYPAYIIGTYAGHGAIGSCFVLWIAGLVGCGRWRLGALFLGFAPAVHPAMGAWAWLVHGLAFLSLLRSPGSIGLRGVLPWFGAGASVTLLSLAVQMLWLRDPAWPGTDPAAYSRLMAAEARYWCPHRQPFDLLSSGVLVGAATLLISWAWLLKRSQELTPGGQWFFRTVLLSSVLGAFASAILWIPPERVPAAVIAVMPGRFLNYNIYLLVPLVVGLMRRQRSSLVHGLGLLALAFSILLLPRSGFIAVLGLCSLICMAHPVGLVYGILHKVGATGATPIIRSASLAVLLLVAGRVGWNGVDTGLSKVDLLRDRTNDPFFAQIAQAEGLILPGEAVTAMQLRTRRPVLIEFGTQTILPYTPEMASQIRQVLIDVFGYDLLDPPQVPGLRPRHTAKALTEEISRIAADTLRLRSVPEWKAIRDKYGVTDIVVHSSWTVQLPEIDRGHGFVLYRIPRGSGEDRAHSQEPWKGRRDGSQSGMR